MSKTGTLVSGISLLGFLGLCFVIHADTGKKGPSASQEPLVDPECSVVDIVTLDNRVIDVQPGDVFYLTASGPTGEKGVTVDLDDGSYGVVVRTGSRVPVAYYAPGVYRITCDVDGNHLKPIKVNVIAPPKDLDNKPSTPKSASLSLNAMTAMAASSPIGGSVGSVYAGDYNSGTIGKYPIRIVVQSAGDFSLTNYGGRYSQTWHFNAPGEITDVVDGPRTGQSQWTLIKSGGSGTHVLSPNSPSKLKINKIRMHSGPAYVAQPRADLTSSNIYLATSTPLVLVVDPGPGWASNNTPRTDQLYEWKTNNVSLPVPCFAVSNAFSFATPGTYQVSVECRSPTVPPQIKSLTITVIPGVQSVEWLDKAGDPITMANNHPTVGVGLKYYPDAVTPTDGWNDRVKIRVTIVPPVSGVAVQLQHFDPDDPSDDSDVVDNDTDGGDNRGTSNLGSSSGTTDGSGQVTVDYFVAHQPGDNHRIAATTLGAVDLAVLNNNNVRPNNSQVAVFGGVISDVLTVWRKLHVEIDSMASVPPQQPAPDQVLFTGSLWDLTPLGDGKSLLKIYSPASGLVLDEFYQNGSIQSGTTVFHVDSSDSLGLGWHDLIIPAEPSAAEQVAFVDADNTLCDDDGYCLPPSFSPPLPKLNLITDKVREKYFPAYIYVEQVADSDNSNKTITFHLNTSTGILFTDLDDATDIANADCEKWWGFLLASAFQPASSEDGDPDSGTPSGEAPTQGETTSNWAIDVCAIYLEAIRENCNGFFGNPVAMATVMQDELDGTVAHELGHPPGNSAFYSDHSELGLMGAGSTSGTFKPATLKRFRSAVRWSEI
jgi:hypothetical protein